MGNQKRRLAVCSRDEIIHAFLTIDILVSCITFRTATVLISLRNVSMRTGGENLEKHRMKRSRHHNYV